MDTTKKETREREMRDLLLKCRNAQCHLENLMTHGALHRVLSPACKEGDMDTLRDAFRLIADLRLAATMQLNDG